MDFDDFFSEATGHEPYPWQRAVANRGLPTLIEVPTGAGKTAGVVLPWLWRRGRGLDPGVRRLVFVLPMRVLVDQVAQDTRRWIDRLGLADSVNVSVVRGGDGGPDTCWRDQPEQDAVVVGTVDMLLSRALNRGYGMSRFLWPVDFGILHAGSHWVFDEVQLLGPALPTSRQLEAFRQKLRTAMPTASTWMSATVPHSALRTVDSPDVPTIIGLTADDSTGPLAVRLGARRAIRRLGDKDEVSEDVVASRIATAHREGSLTLAVCNTVARARGIHLALSAILSDLPVQLLHSQFRPADRAPLVSDLLTDPTNGGRGRIVVSTQVVEAGVDLSASVLYTDAAPWPSIIQRVGRCNRDGRQLEGLVLWSEAPGAAPYNEIDVRSSVDALVALEGSSVTSADLTGMGVEVSPRFHPVLRLRDLVGLFDTTTDLAGVDIDVAPYIREGDDTDVSVAWLPTDSLTANRVLPPGAAARCPVPIGEVKREVKAKKRVIRQLDGRTGTTTSVRNPNEVRPGMLFLFATETGGYRPDVGWDPPSRAVVDIVSDESVAQFDAGDVAIGDDPASTPADRRWVRLQEHLREAEASCRELLDALDPPDVPPAWREAAAVAARLHDIGKAHEVFQESLVRVSTENERAAVLEGRPWAKSGSRQRLHHRRRHFRHELASAMALVGIGASALDDLEERDLAVYLVAAHHGRVRMAIRSQPDESRQEAPAGERMALGVMDGDLLPITAVPGGHLPSMALDLSPMEMGERPDGSPSWAAMALALRDRVGPFRLAFLEAVVRVSDWRASGPPPSGPR